MKKLIGTLLIAIVLVTLTCSLAHSAQGDIWLAGYLLLTLKSPTGDALQQRVDAVQARANDLLMLSSTLPKITVKKTGANYSIYADKKVFLTVTAADARSYSTTTQKLANQWAHKLRVTLPKATPIKH